MITKRIFSGSIPAFMALLVLSSWVGACADGDVVDPVVLEPRAPREPSSDDALATGSPDPTAGAGGSISENGPQDEPDGAGQPPPQSAGGSPATMGSDSDDDESSPIDGSGGGSDDAEGDAQTEPDGSPSGERGDFRGDSRCDTLDSLFCDDFEGTSLDAAWQHEGPGSASIESERSARGDQSLHIHTTGNGFSLLRITSIFPVPDNRYYGRMFVRFGALPEAPIWAHWTIAEAAGAGDGSLIRVGGQLDDEHNRFGVGTDKGSTGDWTRADEDGADGDTEVPEDTWLCVEWLHDGAADVTRFYVDGEERPSLATASDDHEGTGTYDLPQLESVWIGWWLYQADPSPGEYDVWIDEVAFAEERIGCVD